MTSEAEWTEDELRDLFDAAAYGRIKICLAHELDDIEKRYESGKRLTQDQTLDLIIIAKAMRRMLEDELIEYVEPSDRCKRPSKGRKR